MILLASLSSNAFADSMFVKLGRGLTNIVTSPLEILVQPLRTLLVDQKVALSPAAGLFQGLYYTIARAISGAYDLVTFPVPVPKDYGSLIKPSTVFEGASSIEAGVWPYPKYGFGRVEKESQDSKRA